MKKILLLLTLLLPQIGYCQSTSAESLFELGSEAFIEKKFQESESLMLKAANKGYVKAYGFLAMIYGSGYLPEGMDLDKAMHWASEGFKENDIPSTISMSSILFYEATDKDMYKLSKDIMEMVFDENKSSASGANLIAACWVMIGNNSKAKLWANTAINLAKDDENEKELDKAHSLLAKIAYEEKNYNKAIAFSEEAAKRSEIPLAQYIKGKCMIKNGKDAVEGKKWVKEAAAYAEYELFDFKCFEEEINNYWNKINNKKF